MTRTYVSKINDKWYAFAGDTTNDQVYSIGTDNPPKSTGCERYFARWTDRGIQYVASSSPTKQAAVAKAKRHGDFFGVV